MSPPDSKSSVQASSGRNTPSFPSAPYDAHSNTGCSSVRSRKLVLPGASNMRCVEAPFSTWPTVHSHPTSPILFTPSPRACHFPHRTTAHTVLDAVPPSFSPENHGTQIASLGPLVSREGALHAESILLEFGAYI